MTSSPNSRFKDPVENGDIDKEEELDEKAADQTIPDEVFLFMEEFRVLGRAVFKQPKMNIPGDKSGD
jgi:hypothetical protein